MRLTSAGGSWALASEGLGALPCPCKCQDPAHQGHVHLPLRTLILPLNKRRKRLRLMLFKAAKTPWLCLSPQGELPALPIWSDKGPCSHELLRPRADVSQEGGPTREVPSWLHCPLALQSTEERAGRDGWGRRACCCPSCFQGGLRLLLPGSSWGQRVPLGGSEWAGSGGWCPSASPQGHPTSCLVGKEAMHHPPTCLDTYL